MPFCQKLTKARHKMKKLLISLITISPMFLTSCAINWFEENIFVPWWIGLLFVLIIVLIVFAFLLKKYSSDYRTCPSCNNRFKPKWYECFKAIFIGEKNTTERVFKCPSCKESNLMPISFNQNSDIAN